MQDAARVPGDAVDATAPLQRGRRSLPPRRWVDGGHGWWRAEDQETAVICREAGVSDIEREGTGEREESRLLEFDEEGRKMRFGPRNRIQIGIGGEKPRQARSFQG
jgi:hypothetical protein